MRPTDISQFFTSPQRVTFRIDQAVSDLGFAAQFVVWAMRIQWAHIGDGGEASLVVQRACHAADMPEGAALVAELTAALMRATSRPLAFPCPKWRVLTSDEARLLSFISAMQMRDGTPHMECDAEWRQSRHASAIWNPAQRLALSLSAAGLYLTLPAISNETTPFDTAPLYH